MEEKNLAIIKTWIQPKAKILDLGCGDGDFLDTIAKEHNTQGIGVEIDETLIDKCINLGLQVINTDIEGGLIIFQDNSFDCTILSQTLQELNNPQLVINEMLRIGKQAIVTFDNASYWKNRINFLFGKAPSNSAQAKNVNQRLITVADFEHLCNSLKVKIVEKKYFTKSDTTSTVLFCEQAAYLIEK